jgi:DinB family protein
LFEKNRQLTAEILRRLPDGAFERWGVHNERGKVSLREYLAIVVDHLQHHLKFAREKRAMVEKG